MNKFGYTVCAFLMAAVVVGLKGLEGLILGLIIGFCVNEDLG